MDRARRNGTNVRQREQDALAALRAKRAGKDSNHALNTAAELPLPDEDDGDVAAWTEHPAAPTPSAPLNRLRRKDEGTSAATPARKSKLQISVDDLTSSIAGMGFKPHQRAASQEQPAPPLRQPLTLHSTGLLAQNTQRDGTSTALLSSSDSGSASSRTATATSDSDSAAEEPEHSGRGLGLSTWETGQEEPPNASRHRANAGSVSAGTDASCSKQDSDERRATAEEGALVLEGGYVLPATVARRLYAHQLEGVRWMWSLQRMRSGGILGDDMGG